MIPQFPTFKNLEVSDKEDIQNITKNFEPYSDFDFFSLWFWNIKDNYQLSILNGNLVVRLFDYYKDEPYYSFLGNNKLEDTLQQLFSLSAFEGSKIQLVPEVSILGIDLNKYFMEIDFDNCDYIYDLELLSTYSGPQYYSKRKLLNKFVQKNKDFRTETIDLSTEENKKRVLSLAEIWSKNKDSGEAREFISSKESLAIHRLLEANFEEIIAIGVFIGTNLVGVEIFTLADNQYAISHFSKTFHSLIGLYEYLCREYSIYLLNKGVKFLNAEEDLGLPGLRFSKNSFKPTHFFRKFSVIKK